jgi:hypothetical protein
MTVLLLALSLTDPATQQIMAIAYLEEPCPAAAEKEEEISWLPIIVGIVAG